MNTSPLFSPFHLGPLQLRNRFVMAPLTRGRAEADGSPNDLMVEYYRQRASAGLIVSEATAISPQGFGWLNAPGIYSERHVKGWRRVTDGVHQKGGRIFLQLWHMGRVSHPDFLQGELPVGPSALTARGDTHTPVGKKDYVTPRELSLQEIRSIVQDYGTATQRAQAAGFDGVEIHGANGYLIDQFLRDGSNQRRDEFGGSVENRVRFVREVTAAVVSAWSSDRVGIRLSPLGAYNDMRDSDPVTTFGRAAEELDRFDLAYLHVMEGLPGHWSHVAGERVGPHLRKAFRGPLIVNGGYDAALAAKAIAQDETDLVAFGVAFLANPDLVERVRSGAPLNPPDMATFYSAGSKGYTDYPVHAGPVG